MWETLKFTKHFRQHLMILAHIYDVVDRTFSKRTIVMDTDWEANSPNLINSTWMFKTLPLLWITHTTAASNCRDNEKVTILFQEKPKTKKLFYFGSSNLCLVFQLKLCWLWLSYKVLSIWAIFIREGEKSLHALRQQRKQRTLNVSETLE